MARKAIVVTCAAAFSAVFLYTFLHARLETKLAAVEQAMSAMSACASLRLGMTRADVERVMGPSAREFRTEGPSGEEALALHFPTPVKEERYPLVVVERGRVVETVCSEKGSLTATPEELDAIFAHERLQRIGADDGRP